MRPYGISRPGIKSSTSFTAIFFAVACTFVMHALPVRGQSAGVKDMSRFAALRNLQHPTTINHQPTTNNHQPASSFAPDVIDQWMGMQIRLMSSTIASFNGPFVRIYSYCGVAAFEALRPGLSAKSPYQYPVTALNGFPEMPSTEPGKPYCWPASVNAALAFMHRRMLPYTGDHNKRAIDSLEQLVYSTCTAITDSATLKRSAAFGRAVAEIVFKWAEEDGATHAGPPYTAPRGPGKWVPTPPNFAPPSTPYWGGIRTMVSGSIENTSPPPPTAYSEDSSSAFYKMAKQVYDTDMNLTEEQRAIAMFWKDINPGFTAPGHWLSIIRQVFLKEKGKVKLDKAAFTYAITGMSLNDAWISSWKTRYEYNLLRPVTYIRNVLGHKDWLPLIPTPPHPEYAAGFAAMAGAIAESLTLIYGNAYPLTDHTYDSFGMKPRRFDSFLAIAREASDSKFYGGIHFKPSVDAGLEQGRDVAQRIEVILFRKKPSAGP